MPITFCGRPVTAAIFEMEIEDVLLARIASLGARLSNCSNISSFNSEFSVAASTTSSAFFHPFTYIGLDVDICQRRFFCSSVTTPFANLAVDVLSDIAIGLYPIEPAKHPQGYLESI